MQILKVIQNHGYTLEQVANMLGITKGSLSATINGSPNVKKLIDIALKIGCSPAEFFADWYENEGKDMQRSASSATSEEPAAEPSPKASEQQSQADALPFGQQEPEKKEEKQEPALTPDVAFICPHCHEAIKLGFIK